MSRAVRKVTKDWVHPKRADGSYEPMYDEDYGDVLNEWLRENKEWSDGIHPDLLENPSYKKEYPFYAQWCDDPPAVRFYKTTKDKEEDLTYLQMYETTSEGTPISPVFEKAEDLARWLANTGASAFAGRSATYDQWLAMINRGWAISAVGTTGGLVSGVEA